MGLYEAISRRLVWGLTMSMVIQIKGSNASGKTTIVKQLIELSNNVRYLRWNNGKVYATVMDDLKWVAVGLYDDKPMGGCDRLSTVDTVKRAIVDIIDDYPHYVVVFEGMMISTIKSTFYNYLSELSESDNICPVFVILRTDIDSCVGRLKARRTHKGTVKQSTIDNMAYKCKTIERHALTYDQDRVAWMDTDTVNVSSMVGTFLELVSHKGCKDV